LRNHSFVPSAHGRVTVVNSLWIILAGQLSVEFIIDLSFQKFEARDAAIMLPHLFLFVPTEGTLLDRLLLDEATIPQLDA